MVLHHVLCTRLQPPARKDASAQASVAGSSLCVQITVGRKLADAAEGLHNLVQSTALKLYHLERPSGAAFSCHCPVPKPSAPNEGFGLRTFMLLMQIHRSQGMTQDEAHEIQQDIAACLSSLCYHSASTAPELRNTKSKD